MIERRIDTVHTTVKKSDLIVLNSHIGVARDKTLRPTHKIANECYEQLTIDHTF